MALDSPGTGTPCSAALPTPWPTRGRGDYPVGTRLPPEFTLGRMFGASRFTTREALVGLALIHEAPKSYSPGPVCGLLSVRF
jgi:Bacterial regulatory proteins, gntR family